MPASRAEHLYNVAEAEQYLGTLGFSLEQTRPFPYHYAFRGRVRSTPAR